MNLRLKKIKEKIRGAVFTVKNITYESFNKTTDTKKKFFWSLLLFISFAAIVAMWTNAIGSGGSSSRTKSWHGILVIPFYFTFQSNLIAFVVAFLNVFNIIKSEKLKRRLEIFMVTNLTITLLIYWTVLFPSAISKDSINYFEWWLTNLLVHLFTPIASFLAFAFAIKQTSKEDTATYNIWKDSLWFVIYPTIWLLISIIFYYSLGGNKEDAIYKFLDLNNKPGLGIGSIIGIAVLYYGITSLFTFISNLKHREQKPKMKSEKTKN